VCVCVCVCECVCVTCSHLNANRGSATFCEPVKRADWCGSVSTGGFNGSLRAAPRSRDSVRSCDSARSSCDPVRSCDSARSWIIAAAFSISRLCLCVLGEKP